MLEQCLRLKIRPGLQIDGKSIFELSLFNWPSIHIVPLHLSSGAYFMVSLQICPSLTPAAAAKFRGGYVSQTK